MRFYLWTKIRLHRHAAAESGKFSGEAEITQDRTEPTRLIGFHTT